MINQNTLQQLPIQGLSAGEFKQINKIYRPLTPHANAVHILLTTSRHPQVQRTSEDIPPRAVSFAGPPDNTTKDPKSDAILRQK
jgi:hypothetical protein